MSGRRIDRLLEILAALVCLTFALGLLDTPLMPLPVAVPSGVDLTLRAPARGTVQLFREIEGAYEYVAEVSIDEQGNGQTVAPRGRYVAVARAPGKARALATIELTADDELRLEAGPEHHVTLTVRGPDGPLPDATILLTPVNPTAEALEVAVHLPFGATTGRDGKARLDSLPPGPYRARIHARGFDSLDITLEGDLEVALTKTRALEVLVRDDQERPVAGATVVISGTTLWPPRSVVTGADGTAQVSGLPAGTYDLVARDASRISAPYEGLTLGRDGGATADAASSSSASPPARHERVVLTLRPGRFLSVSVADAGEHPVPGADLVLAEAGVATFPSFGTTDSSGAARLGPLGYARAHLSVRADGYVPRSIWVEDESEIEVELTKTGTLIGRVVDERGFPLPSVSIEIIGTDVYGMPVSISPESFGIREAHFDWASEGPRPLIPAGELGVMPGPIPPIPLRGAVPVSENAGSWVTAGDGRFTAQQVSPGELRVIARHPEFVDEVSEAIHLAPGGRAEVEIVMHPGRRVQGRLTDPQGFPVAGARLHLQAVRGAFDRHLLTNPDGTFVVPSAPRELWVSATRLDDPLRIVFRKKVVLGDDPHELVELEMPEPRPEVRLRVVDHEERPIALAQVTLLSLDPEIPLRETRFSDDRGGIELDDAAGIRGRIVIEAPGYARFDEAVGALPEERTIVLGRAVTISGRVTAVRGRAAADNARIVIRADGARRETRTNDLGEYELHGLAPGKIEVTAEHPDLGRASLTTTIRALDHDRPFEIPPLDLVETASVSGRVVDAQGDPVVGARVGAGVVPAFLPQGALPHGLVLTNDRGEFTLDGVEPGHVVIEAFSPIAGRGQSESLNLESGDDKRDVVLELVPSETTPLDHRGSVAVTLGENDVAGGVAVVIVQVAAESEAERAGLVAGDRLLAVDGTPTASMQAARTALNGPAGTDIVVAVKRQGRRLELRVSRESVTQ